MASVWRCQVRIVPGCWLPAPVSTGGSRCWSRDASDCAWGGWKHTAGSYAGMQSQTRLRCGSAPSRGRRPEGPGRTPRIVGLLAAVAVFASCQDTTEPAGGWLTAAIREATDTGGREATYRGSGGFHVGRDPGAGVSVAFGLHSRGTGASVGQSLGLYRPGHGRPGPGRYELAPLNAREGRLEGFTVFYASQPCRPGRGLHSSVGVCGDQRVFG